MTAAHGGKVWAFRLRDASGGGNRWIHYRKLCDRMNLFSLCMFLWFQGAFWGLMVGLAVGVCRMVLEFVYPSPGCGVVDTAPAVLRGVHYLHFAILLCGLTAGVVAVISLLTPPPSHEQVGSLLYSQQQHFRRSVTFFSLSTCDSSCFKVKQLNLSVEDLKVACMTKKRKSKSQMTKQNPAAQRIYCYAF